MSECKNLLSIKHEIRWFNTTLEKPKLRSYVNFKHEYKTEKYIHYNYTKLERSLSAQFRAGILPLRIETGRYRYEPLEERICIFCDQNKIESEQHFIFECSLYDPERLNLFCGNEIDKNNNVTYNDKIYFLFENHTRKIVLYIKNAFLKRKSILYKS